MAISRPFLLALLGAALLAVTGLVVHNARNTSADDSTPAAQQQPAQQATQPAAQQLTPDQTLESAFSTAKLKSASFDARLNVRFRKQAGTIALTGAFQSAGAGKMPKVAVQLRTHVPGSSDVRGSFVTTGDKAWFVGSGTAYRVPQNAWDLVVKARKSGGGGQASTPLPVNPKTWLRNVKSEGTTTIHGVKTEHVSASIDAAAAIRDLVKVAQQTGESQALPAGFEKRVDKFVKRADFDVYVGKDDHVLRRFTGNLRLAIPGSGPIVLRVNVDLTKVGEPQRIEAPSGARTGLPDTGFGQLSRVVLSGIAGIAGADANAVRAATANGPRRFSRAFDQHRKIVLFFGQGGSDDQATALAVQSATRGAHVVVIGDTVGNVDAYGKLVQRLGVDHAPAIVLVDRRGRARLLEGYVDSGVLRQAIADAR
jgi:hypothetical protein